MSQQVFKTLIAIVFLVGMFGLSTRPAYAISCGAVTTGGAPAPQEIVCSLARITNILLLSAGAFLLIMLLIGGLKLSLAHGDPKGMQAASGTWTYAIIGFFVIVGSITLLTLVGKLIGWNYTSPFDSLQTAIIKFTTMVGPK